MREIVITKDEAGQRLNKLVMKYLDKAPSGFVYKMIRKKNIKLNGEKAVGNEIVYVGDCVQLYLSDDTIASFQSDKKKGRRSAPPFRPEVIYHDENVIIVNKPAGVLSQKAMRDDYSINESIIDYMLDNGYMTVSQMRTFKPSVCNRLDRNTSGLILGGVSLMGSQELSRIIRDRLVDKYYYTIVRGELKSETEAVGYIVKNEQTNQVSIYDSPEEAGELADRCERVHSVFTPVRAANGYSELCVKLITGKTHQIRAQLAHMGYPIVGDTKYGDTSTNIEVRQAFGLRNQLLHCGQLTFHGDIGGGLGYLGGRTYTAFKPELYKKIEKGLLG